MTEETVIIFGAGAIRAAAGNKSLAKTPPLDRDFFDIASKLKASTLYKSVINQVNKLVGAYSSEVLKSLEDTTTLLYLKAINSEHKSIEYKTFLKQLELLETVLAETTNQLRVGPKTTIYRLILHELKRLQDPKHLTIITFNYDLMIERTLDEIQKHAKNCVLTFPGCYRLPTSIQMVGISGKQRFSAKGYNHDGVAILKLHGSLNWQSKHTSKSPTPTALFNTERKLNIANTISITPNLSWKQKKKTHYMKPIIIPPIAGKRELLHADIGVLWKNAADALNQATRFIVFGYSCPPLDFEAKMLLGENVQQNKTKDLIVIDTNPSIASKFMSICGIDNAHTYTSTTSLFAKD